MIRSTTNGTLNSYRYNLQRSTYTLNKARDTVQTGRQFNSFAEDPAAAAKSFQLRRSYQRTQSQLSISDSVSHKYDVAWSTLESVISEVNTQKGDSAYKAIINAENDTNGTARKALGQNLCQRAENLAQAMNGRYGDNYVFSGADGLNIPFTWETGEDGSKTLCYRGISVDTAVPDVQTENGEFVLYDENYTVIDPTDPNANDAVYYKKTGVEDEYITITEYEKLEQDLNTLNYMSQSEATYADLGMGLKKDSDGNILSSSAINVALQGINFVGYGVDEDGDPKNIISIMNRMGEILQNCDEDSGEFAAGEREEFYRLAEKFEDAASLLSDKHVELDAQADYIQSNQKELETLSDTLNDQIVAVEDVDAAAAITDLSWAQYCYNAALQAGKSILSNSLMDYLQS